jgi:hypothetical protein
MHVHLKLFYSLITSPKFPYICFGLRIDNLQGVTNYTYFASICSVNCYMQSRSLVLFCTKSDLDCIKQFTEHMDAK